MNLTVKRFGVNRPNDRSIAPKDNVASGDLAYVMTNDKPNELQTFQLGLTPSCAKKTKLKST